MRTETTDAKKIKHVAIKNRWHFRAQYSGRAMFGAYCPGIVCSGDEVKDVIAAVRKAKVKASVSFDTMGRDMIVYWPHIETDPATFEEGSDE